MYVLEYFWKLLFTLRVICSASELTYISLERARTIYHNPKYVTEFVGWTRRLNRKDPMHYYNLNITTVIWGGNNFTVNYYFYQFLTNTYKPSFVEMHMGVCDMFDKAMFLGTDFRGALGLDSNAVCPFHPGRYTLRNISVVPPQQVMKSFPFNKGRILINITYTPNNELVTSGTLDMELRQIRRKN